MPGFPSLSPFSFAEDVLWVEVLKFGVMQHKKGSSVLFSPVLFKAKKRASIAP